MPLSRPLARCLVAASLTLLSAAPVLADALQDGVAAIPKASRAESQKANLDALKLSLDDDDRKAIAALPKDRRCVSPGFGPDWD